MNSAERDKMKIIKLLAVLSASMIASASVGCRSKSSSSRKSNRPDYSTSTAASESGKKTKTTDNGKTEAETAEPTTQHISPVETLSASCSSQYNAGKVIERTDGSNTLKIPLSEFIEEGDEVSSFIFTIYSADGGDIGTFKGGCGISVNEDCAAATTKGWYQSKDFSAATQGSYGEIRWDVPAEIRSSISAGGEVMFGYWWGNSTSIRIESAVCEYTRTRDIPVDGTVSYDVGKSVEFSADDNKIRVPAAEFLPENAVPEAVIYNVSSSGGFRKFTGAFGYSSSAGSYQSGDTAVYTDSSSLSLTWFVPDEAKALVSKDGEIVLGYWWSEQPSVKLDSITVKYSQGDGSAAVPAPKKTDSGDKPKASSGFRKASQIVDDIKVGWNLGNTLECYDYKSWSSNAETAWGNPATTKDMIKAVKDAGFNAIRIPVTWGEHMESGNTIDSAWMSRVKEVVDYAYSEDLTVILNMHHDDYVWFTPSDAEYDSDRAKLIDIWKQICSVFGDYGDRLIFEGMNEPRTVGSSAEWSGGTTAERKVVNKYAQDFVDTVRASGGNNAERTLIVTSYAASAETSAINDVVVPKDDNIILSIHYYAPWNFAEGKRVTFGDQDRRELDAKFTELRQKFVAAGTPVMICEFGCVAAADDATRADYYNYYISSAKANGIKCFVWDNGVSSGKDSYGIFNRTALSWNTVILDGIMKGAE